MRWSWKAGLTALALASLAAAFLLKHPCTVNDWHDWYQYKHYCYSDVLPIYYAKGLDTDTVPYFEKFNEYPVGTGYFMYVVARATEGLREYLYLSFSLLLIAAGFTTLAIWRAAADWRMVLGWSLAPTVPIHGLTNWDLLAVALAAGGWLVWRRATGQAKAAAPAASPAVAHGLSAFLFGLGGAAKLYPAFFLPFLFFDRIRARDRRGAATTLAGGTLGLAGPNVAVAIPEYDGWIATWRFHADREPDFETPWEAFWRPLLEPLFPDYGWDAAAWTGLVEGITMAAMAAGLLWFAWVVWRDRADALAAGGLLVLVFTLVNKVYSPQYTLWVLPILLLVRAPWKALVPFVVFDTANFFIRYNLFTPPEGATGGWNEAWLPWSHAAVTLRWVFLAWATWAIARHHGFVGRPDTFEEVLPWPGVGEADEDALADESAPAAVSGLRRHAAAARPTL